MDEEVLDEIYRRVGKFIPAARALFFGEDFDQKFSVEIDFVPMSRKENESEYFVAEKTTFNYLHDFLRTELYRGLAIGNAPQSGANPWGCTDYLNHKNDISETGVSVCEWSGDYSMHTKGILIDGNISIIGSFNWDMRSTYLDTEMMPVVDCPALNAVLCREANEMVRQSRTILPDGSTVGGSEYIESALPLTKKMAQALLRIVIRPFRYVL